MHQILTIANELNLQLEALTGLQEQESQSIIKAIDLTADAITKIKSVTDTEPFTSEEEEIQFFKEIKPQLDGKIIYYMLLLKLIEKIKVCTAEQLKTFYIGETMWMQSFYNNSEPFVIYCRMNYCHLDNQYFLRTTNRKALYFQNKLPFDFLTNSPMSVEAATLFAYDLYQLDITEKLTALNRKADYAANPLPWTGSKTDLIELMYGLQTRGVFGNADMKTISECFSTTFDVDFGNVYRTWESIRLRKKNLTPFLDGLPDCLKRRIDNENAM